MRYLGVRKAENLEVQEAEWRVTIFRGVTQCLVQNEGLVLPRKS